MLQIHSINWKGGQYLLRFWNLSPMRLKFLCPIIGNYLYLNKSWLNLRFQETYFGTFDFRLILFPIIYDILMCKQCCFASMKQFLKLISAWAYEGHLRNALTGVATNKPLPASPISEYNPSKQYWQAGPIILYEWCYCLRSRPTYLNVVCQFVRVISA